MSSKSPPLTPEQIAFENAMRGSLAPGITVGFGRNESGAYHASYVGDAWKLWQKAREYERSNCSLCRYATAEDRAR